MPLSKVGGLCDFLHFLIQLGDHLMGTFMNRRLQNVSSDALRPTWIPYASTAAGEEVLVFSLKIMMGWYRFSLNKTLPLLAIVALPNYLFVYFL